MPFVFLIVGVMLITIGARNQSANAIQLLQSEFTGSNSYIQWFIAVMVLGLIGYYKPVKPLADGLIGLVILVMILNDQTKSNLFGAFETALQNTTPTPAPASPQLSTSSGIPLSNSTQPNNLFGSSQTLADNLNSLAGGAMGLAGITPSYSLDDAFGDNNATGITGSTIGNSLGGSLGFSTSASTFSDGSFDNPADT